MFEKITEQARNMLIQKKVGLISGTDLVNWADETLKTVETAPGFLVSISMGESLAFVPRLDLDQYPIVEDDCPKIAHLMLSLYTTGNIGFEQIGKVSWKMAQELDDDFCDCSEGFYSIDSAVDLFGDSIISESEAHQIIIDKLGKIAGTTPEQTSP